MAYQVNFSDSVNKGSIFVEDGTINQETSLGIPGRNSTAYGTVIGENFLHLLENFANDNAPDNPVEGQLWYDTSIESPQLKLYDGTDWISASGLKKGTTIPDIAASTVGDLWVDTDNAQLYLFTGVSWVLVGPTFSDGLVTGAQPLQILGNDNNIYTVLSIEVRSAQVAIISNSSFTPAALIPGFSTINPGINLNSNTISGSNYKFRGIAEKAESLIVGNETVPATEFVRTTATSTTNFPLRIKNNGGLSLGVGNQLTIGVEGEAGIINHNTAGANIDLRVNNNGTATTVIRVDSNTNVGINNEAPEQALDVTGNIQTSGQLLITGTDESTSLSTGSIITQGGAAIAKNLLVGGNLEVTGILTTQNLSPDRDNARNLGNAGQRWASVFANQFVGNLQGNVTGQVSGRAGSADQLTSTTEFRLTGDVSAQSFEFDGKTGGTVKEFRTSIANNFIALKPAIVDIEDTDELLLNRGSDGLRKVSIASVLRDIRSIVPVGTIVPFGGNVAPAGWLVCNGNEISKSVYNELFTVIGFNFRDPSLISDSGVSFFALPDMRGRFPLGLDNMGGTAANRVTSNGATAIGNNLGSENVTIGLENLPEHEHDLRGESGDQYYVIRDIQGAPQDVDAIRYDAPTGNQAGQALPSSGGIKTSSALGEPIDVMNPYLALNYIIYTGVV